MKKILSLILSFLFVYVAYADDINWRLHPIFDEEVSHVVETPNYVYFTSRNLVKNSSNDTYFSLFRYDKKGEELMPLSTSNILNGNSIRDIIYNPEKGYLAVLYKDFEIDLLYNDGSVSYIPYYSQASISYPKDVYSMSNDPANDRIYLATQFGYLAINDKKNEVAESRLYGVPFNSYCRIGDFYFVAKDKELLMAPVASQRLSMDQYEIKATFNNPMFLYPVGDKVCVISIGNNNNNRELKLMSATDSDYEIKDLEKANIINIEYNSKGLVIVSDKAVYQILPDGSISSIEKPAGYTSSSFATENMVEFWSGEMRKGLSSLKRSNDNWTVTRDWMRPNAPATYVSTSFVNHPEKGLMMLSYGNSLPTYRLYSNSPFQLSAYNKGKWTNYATAYTNPERKSMLTSTSGIAVDPDNSKYVYITSFHNGLARLNLNDPNDIIHLSHSKDPDIENEGFIVFDLFPETSPNYSNIATPFFDKQGNLWMAYANNDDVEDPNPHYYCWLADDRKTTTSAHDIKLPKHVEFDVYCPVSNYLQSIGLTKTGNGIMVRSAGTNPEKLIMIDTNGSPLDLNDDKLFSFPDFTDADGSDIDMGRVNYLWEDPSTGNVWVCHANGIFYFVPSQVRVGNYQTYRIKVARNDGTNLADYLLDGVSVNHIASDSEGRKWISTQGGVVCTSADGREILEEFNTSNSPLPSDVVYGISYNAATNSLLISTSLGYAEYMLPVSQTSSTKEDIRAYPNPVRPGYSGYVTITDIPQGSFVKIADSAGNLVKELGVMSGFEILWDISDSNFNRVKSGVYHILVSPSNENSSYSTVGKILVMS